MGHAVQKMARSLVVMVAAGGQLDDVLELAKAFGVRAVQVEQLAVPAEEENSQRRLVLALKA